jgi:hypothetical protein
MGVCSHWSRLLFCKLVLLWFVQGSLFPLTDSVYTYVLLWFPACTASLSCYFWSIYFLHLIKKKKPNDGGNGPMKSIPQQSKISMTRIGFKGIMWCFEIDPNFWQFSQVLQNAVSPWTWWASKIHFVRFSQRSFLMRNDPRMPQNDKI